VSHELEKSHKVRRSQITLLTITETWGEFPWPDWVPAIVRQQVAAQWGFGCRTPKQWAISAYEFVAPRFGARLTLQDWAGRGPARSGRFIFMWNNVGCLVSDDGEAHYVAFGRGSRQLDRSVQWYTNPQPPARGDEFAYLPRTPKKLVESPLSKESAK
jgi:hypothetical protein